MVNNLLSLIIKFIWQEFCLWFMLFDIFICLSYLCRLVFFSLYLCLNILVLWFWKGILVNWNTNRFDFSWLRFHLKTLETFIKGCIFRTSVWFLHRMSILSFSFRSLIGSSILIVLIFLPPLPMNISFIFMVWTMINYKVILLFCLFCFIFIFYIWHIVYEWID